MLISSMYKNDFSAWCLGKYEYVIISISQFEGGCEEGFFYRTSKTRELDEVIGDIFHKVLGRSSFPLTASSQL